jgi:membrane protease YdiL (CAAX protease family)
VIQPLDNRPWGLGHAFGAVGAGLGAALIAALAVGPELSDTETFRVVVPAQTLAQMALVSYWASRGSRRRLALGLRFRTGDLVGLAYGVAAQTAASIVLFPIVWWVLDGDAPTQEIVDTAAGLGGPDLVLVALGAGILAPAAEELVFRGVMLRALLVSSGPRAATYATAAVFAALHLLDPNAWLVVPLLFALGVVLAKQAISTGRLAMSFFTHAAFNLVAVVALFAAE